VKLAFLIGREALGTVLPNGNLAACPVERSQQEMERTTLSTGLSERQRWDEVFDSVDPHAFTSDAHRKVFDATCSARRSGGQRWLNLK